MVLTDVLVPGSLSRDRTAFLRVDAQFSMFSMRSTARVVPPSARASALNCAERWVTSGSVMRSFRAVRRFGGGVLGVDAAGYAQFDEAVGVDELFGGLWDGDHRDACSQAFAAAAHTGVGDEGVRPCPVRPLGDPGVHFDVGWDIAEFLRVGVFADLEDHVPAGQVAKGRQASAVELRLTGVCRTQGDQQDIFRIGGTVPILLGLTGFEAGATNVIAAVST